MSSFDTYDTPKKAKPNVSADLIREQLQQHAKNFKTSWVSLGQALYSVWKDKLFYSWDYEKFEYYTEKELGIRKPIAMRLLKTYYFLEQEEPAYLSEKFPETRAPNRVPGYETIDVLRLAKNKKELDPEDYRELHQKVFEKGKDGPGIRKDLVAMMKERKPVDPDEEKRKRNEVAIRKLLNAIRSFEKDMEALKLIPANLIEEAKELMKKLEGEVK